MGLSRLQYEPLAGWVFPPLEIRHKWRSHPLPEAFLAVRSVQTGDGREKTCLLRVWNAGVSGPEQKPLFETGKFARKSHTLDVL